MTGLLSAPIEVSMNQELITILSLIKSSPDNYEKRIPLKDHLCKEVLCTSILCSNCPFGNIHRIYPNEDFVAQIHKSMEAIS